MRTRFLLALLVCSFLFALSAMRFARSNEHVSSNPKQQPNTKQVDVLDVGRPALKVFTDENGLPSNSVMTLERDRKGYLWVGTQDGAAYFNGHNWTVVNMPNRSVSNYVFDILPASDGSLWFATEGGGVHRLKDGAWQTFDTTKGLPSNSTRALLETKSIEGKSVYWVGTRDGLAKYENEEWNKIDLGNETAKTRIRSLMKASDPNDQTVWVGTYGGLAQIKNNNVTFFDSKSGLPSDVVFCTFETTIFGGKSVVMIGTDAGLAQLSDNVITRFDQNSGAPQKSLRSILETVTTKGVHTLWVGTDSGGVWRFENNHWTNLELKDGLPGNIVLSLLDAGIGDGSIWVSAVGAGLARLERSNWISIDDKRGLPNKIIFSTLETKTKDGNSIYWFATFGGGLARFENGKWQVFDSKNGFIDDFVQSLYETKADDGSSIVWAGTERGVTRLEKGVWKTYPPEQSTLNTETWDFLTTTADDGTNTLWIATSRGLVQIDKNEIKTFNSKNVLPDDRVRVILETRSNDGARTLWAGTYGGGLARFQNGNWEIFNTNNGLPGNRILGLFEKKSSDGVRTLWVGTGGGIARLNLDSSDEKWEIVSNENTPGLLNNNILSFVEDKLGRIYALTNKGITRFTPKTPTEDDPSHYRVYTFTTEDGLPSSECVSGSAYIDSKGRVFAGTVGGVAVLDPSTEIEDNTSDTLFIEKTFIGGQERLLKSNTKLSHNENNLIFEYALMSNFRESFTRYRTQLVGLEDKPTEWTKEARREFNFIPNGSYTFKVWARDHAGNISAPVEIPFAVRPPWWNTWWAFAIYFLLTAGIVSLIGFAIHRNRLNRLIEVERVRTRIATDLHDDIGASLSQISILSEVMEQKLKVQNGLDTKPLAKISETSRELMGSMSDIVWATNPLRDHLRDLIQRMRRFATDTLSSRDIEFVFFAPSAETDMKLDVDVRRQLYLIFKECINNIAKHSDCNEVEIEMKLESGFLTMRVKDKGKGFDVDSSNEGNGLSSMRSRAKSIGGEFELSSSKENGSCVMLKVPRKVGIKIFK